VVVVVVAKSLTALYEAGRRGAGWVKVKPPTPWIW
jgi:ATP-dependent DNA ligase